MSLAGGNDDALLRAIRRWNADASTASTQRQRTAERWHRQAAGEEMHLRGLLHDVMDRNATVRFVLRNGRIHVAAVSAIGRDFVAVRADERPTAVLAIGAIASIDLQDESTHRIASARIAGDDVPDLHAVLSEISGERRVITYSTMGSDAVQSGELMAVGEDVMQVRSARSMFVVIEHICDLAISG
jgi:tRNA pseudouridine-54 N-methylase